jgi:hypothetical protein
VVIGCRRTVREQVGQFKPQKIHVTLAVERELVVSDAIGAHLRFCQASQPMHGCFCASHLPCVSSGRNELIEYQKGTCEGYGEGRRRQGPWRLPRSRQGLTMQCSRPERCRRIRSRCRRMSVPACKSSSQRHSIRRWRSRRYLVSSGRTATQSISTRILIKPAWTVVRTGGFSSKNSLYTSLYSAKRVGSVR